MKGPGSKISMYKGPVEKAHLRNREKARMVRAQAVKRQVE